MFVFPFLRCIYCFCETWVSLCVCVCVYIRVVRLSVGLLVGSASVGMEGPMSHRAPLGPPSAARFHRRRTSGTRDERYRSGRDACVTAADSCAAAVDEYCIQNIW